MPFGTGRIGGLFASGAESQYRRRQSMPWWQQTLLVAAAQPVVGAISEGVTELGKGIFLGNDKDFFETAQGRQAVRGTRGLKAIRKQVAAVETNLFKNNKTPSQNAQSIMEETYKTQLEAEFQGREDKDSLVAMFLGDQKNKGAFKAEGDAYLKKFYKYRKMVTDAPTSEELEKRAEKAGWYGDTGVQKFWTRIKASVDPDKTVDDYKADGLKYILFGEDAHKYSNADVEAFLGGDHAGDTATWLREVGVRPNSSAMEKAFDAYAVTNPNWAQAYGGGAKRRAQEVAITTHRAKIIENPKDYNPALVSFVNSTDGQKAKNPQEFYLAYHTTMLPTDEDALRFININYGPNNSDTMKTFRDLFSAQLFDQEDHKDLTTKQLETVMAEEAKMIKHLGANFKADTLQALGESKLNIRLTKPQVADMYEKYVDFNLRKNITQIDGVAKDRMGPDWLFTMIGSPSPLIGGGVGIADRKAGVNFLIGEFGKGVEDSTIGVWNVDPDKSTLSATTHAFYNRDAVHPGGFYNPRFINIKGEENFLATIENNINAQISAGKIPPGKELQAKNFALSQSISSGDKNNPGLLDQVDIQANGGRLHINQLTDIKELEIRTARALGLPTGPDIVTNTDRIYGARQEDPNMNIPVSPEIWTTEATEKPDEVGKPDEVEKPAEEVTSVSAIDILMKSHPEFQSNKGC